MESALPVRVRLWRFGIYELDESSGELRRGGTLIHLPPQPLQILRLLLARAGQVVDREQIRREVWRDVTVDFDRSLNVAIAQIRSALNDDAASPRFVQTIPRRGYRFLAEVDCPLSDAAASIPARRSMRRIRMVEGAVFILAGVAAVSALRYWRAPAGPVRIAVLPFENLALDPAQSAASDGLFDDLLTRLGGTQPDRMEVIGRRSVSGANARGPGSVRELGKKLNVGYVLESSARRDGDLLRIASRLVETSGETVRWSATFAQDGPAEAFEQRVLARVSAGVLSTLFAGASPAESANFCSDGRDAYETGRMLASRGSLRDLERSLEYFRKAGCPQARAETAEILVRMAKIGSPPPGSWESARAAALSAVTADGGIALAHLALGNIAFWHDWNWNAAAGEYREALRINPSNPDAHHDLAWLQVATRQRGDALASLDTAIALDPLSARTRIDSAWLLLQVGQFGRAGSEARRALELDPGLNEARLCVSRALLYAGDTRAALDAVRPLMPAAILGEIAALPPRAAFRRVVEFHAAAAKSDPYEKAWLMAWLGSRNEALGALEDAYGKRSLMMPLVASDPAFRGIRDEPRFQAILRRMALSQ